MGEYLVHIPFVFSNLPGRFHCSKCITEDKDIHIVPQEANPLLLVTLFIGILQIVGRFSIQSAGAPRIFPPYSNVDEPAKDVKCNPCMYPP
jgi:hypothetical protein